MKHLFTFFLVFAMFAAIAVAHDGAHPMKGTVTAIDDKSITIETLTKETHRISFDAKTTFTMSGSAATVNDLKVGDRVIIEAHDAKGTMHAMSVRFGKPASKDQGQKAKSGAEHGGHVMKDKQ